MTNQQFATIVFSNFFIKHLTTRETILPSQCLVQGFLKIENMTIDGVTIHSPKRDSNGFITFNNVMPLAVGSGKTKMAIL